MSHPRICVVTASGQNGFFGEILDAFAAALRARGLTIEESVDQFPPPEDDLAYLLVPHKYQPLVHTGAPDATAIAPLDRALHRAAGVELVRHQHRPGLAGAAIDINQLGVNELARRGVEVRHAPIRYIPAWDAWHGGEGSGASRSATSRTSK